MITKMCFYTVILYMYIIYVQDVNMCINCKAWSDQQNHFVWYMYHKPLKLTPAWMKKFSKKITILKEIFVILHT